jgi:hypothetical protein
MTDSPDRREAATSEGEQGDEPAKRTDNSTARPGERGTQSDRENEEPSGGDPVESAESDTTSARARFWLTNDVLAVLLVVSFVGVVVGGASGALDLGAVPVEMRAAYLTVSGGAAVWTFGQPAYQAWMSSRSGRSRFRRCPPRPAYSSRRRRSGTPDRRARAPPRRPRERPEDERRENERQ